MESSFIEVSQAEFYRAIGPQNVSPHIEPGPYPYSSTWQTPARRVRGKTVGYYPKGSALAAKRFYLPR